MVHTAHRRPVPRPSTSSTSPSTRLPPIELRVATASPLRVTALPPWSPPTGCQRTSQARTRRWPPAAAPTRALQPRRAFGPWHCCAQSTSPCLRAVALLRVVYFAVPAHRRPRPPPCPLLRRGSPPSAPVFVASPGSTVPGPTTPSVLTSSASTPSAPGSTSSSPLLLLLPFPLLLLLLHLYLSSL